MDGIFEQFQTLGENRQGKPGQEENPQTANLAPRLADQVKDEKGQEKSNPEAIIGDSFALKEQYESTDWRNIKQEKETETRPEHEIDVVQEYVFQYPLCGELKLLYFTVLLKGELIARKRAVTCQKPGEQISQ